MADNVTLNTGAGGEVLATDQLAGGEHVQVVKLADGAADAATRINAGGGVEANALRVTLANDSTGLVSVDDNGGSLTIDAASLPLPTGAATSAAQLVDGHNVTVDNAAGAAAVRNQGADAHDAVVAGNPVLQGGEARTTNPTAVVDGDAVRAMHDDVGRQVIRLDAPRDLVTDNNITLTGTTETTLLAAGGAGVFHDLTMLTFSNSSGTAVRVDIRDATAGTVRLSFFLAASGGGAVVSFRVPKNQTTANNNWTAQLSAVVTDVRIYAQAIANV